jgi:aryl-alcohol dehydrogenase-like predicted oxidoreductase
MNDAVTCAIPGGKTAAQVRENVAAATAPPLDDGTMAAVREIYERRIKQFVRW